MKAGGRSTPWALSERDEARSYAITNVPVALPQTQADLERRDRILAAVLFLRRGYPDLIDALDLDDAEVAIARQVDARLRAGA